MNVLTREQAIKRIKDIENGDSVEHIVSPELSSHYLLNDCERGAINELMAKIGRAHV